MNEEFTVLFKMFWMLTPNGWGRFRKALKKLKRRKKLSGQCGWLKLKYKEAKKR